LSFLSQEYNERILLITKLLALLLHRASSSTTDNDGMVLSAFRKLLETEVLGYFADGAQRLLSREQRSLLRFGYAVTVRWLGFLPFPSPNPQAFLTLQEYLHLTWVVDANAHTYIVTAPLYNVWTRLAMVDQAARRSPLSTHDDVIACDSPVAKLREWMGSLFRGVDPALLHGMGAALYTKATKFNHSCAPNVKFLPTPPPVRARVIALESLGCGAELRTSYIDTERVPVAQRRALLQTNYGFLCDCRACAAPSSAS
jgi:hypothetical protein